MTPEQRKQVLIACRLLVVVLVVVNLIAFEHGPVLLVLGVLVVATTLLSVLYVLRRWREAPRGDASPTRGDAWWRRSPLAPYGVVFVLAFIAARLIEHH